MTQTRLPIGNYVIKTDLDGWVYGKPRMVWNTKKEISEEVFPKPKYTATLSNALTGLLDLVMHESAAQSIRDIRRTIDDFKSEIAELFGVQDG